MQSMKFVEAHHGNKKKVSIYGQEYTNTTYKLCKMNLAIRGISANLGEMAANTFTNDQHKDLKADYIMANPPFNQKEWRGDNELIDDPRWDGYEVPPTSNANYGWILNIVLSRYKLISKGLFACNPMHVGRDERLPIALYEKDNAAIVSPAYFMFEIIDRDVLNEEYLMMWFRRPEFDRECWFMTDGSVRGGITWDDLCRIKLPVPSYARQCEIVESYRAITNRIALKRAENDNLAA